MTSRERVLSELALKEPDRVPYCEIGVEDALLDRMGGREIIRINSPEEPGFYIRDAEQEKSVSRLLHRDNISFPIVPRIFAVEREGKDGRKFYGDGLIRGRGDLKLLDQLPDPETLPIYRDAARFVDQKEDFAACGVVRLGIASTILSMGVEQFSYALYDDPDLVRTVLRTYVEWTAVVAGRMCALGFDVLWAADDIAFKTGTVFSPEVYREMILPELQKVTTKITIPWVYHSDGNLEPVLDDLLSLGMQGLHPIQPDAMDINELKHNIGSRVCLIGNIDIGMLARGTPAQVDSLVRERIAKLAPGGGYIVSSGNSLAAYCDPDNVMAMVRAVKAYGRYPITL